MTASMTKLAIVAVVVIRGLLGTPPALMAQARPIDSGHSKLRVYVSKAGLFSAFGDNHEIEAPIAEGLVDESARKVKFFIDARRMTVLDPQLSPDKRQEVQERMLGPDVLDVARFPEIKFESTIIEQAGPDRLLLRGQLSLHGLRRPVILEVHSEKARYVGTSTLKQQDFGIAPISIGGGTVKVKDEVKIEFDIRTIAQAAEVRSK